MFEFSRPERRVLANSDLECKGSNPAAPTGQSVSNAYGIGSRMVPSAPDAWPSRVVATRAHFLQPVQFPTDAGGAIHCLDLVYPQQKSARWMAS